MTSLRRELLVTLSLGIAAASLLAGWLLRAHFHASGVAALDRTLLAKAGALGTLLERNVDGVEFDFADELMPEFHRKAPLEYFELWRGDAVMERSLSLGTGELPRRTGPATAGVAFDLELPDGRPGRAVGIECLVDWPDAARRDARTEPLHVDLVLATSREALLEADGRVLTALLLAGGVLLATTVLVVAWSARRTGRKVADLAAQVAALDPDGGRPARMPVASCAELVPLAATLERLFERLGAAMQRERRLTSNIAHELRTPVAELRTAVEVARRWPEDGELAAQALAVAEAVARRMSHAIETLLRLGRLEAGQHPLELSVVDVRATIAALLDESAPVDEDDDEGGAADTRAPPDRVTRDLAPVPPLRTDAPLLQVLLGNLICNARQHSPDGTPIRAELQPRRRGARFVLANRSAGLTPEAVRRFGEPFVTGVGAGDSSGHGLGLSLCRAIARTLGFRLCFRQVGDELQAVAWLRDARSAPTSTRPPPLR